MSSSEESLSYSSSFCAATIASSLSIIPFTKSLTRRLTRPRCDDITVSFLYETARISRKFFSIAAAIKTSSHRKRTRLHGRHTKCKVRANSLRQKKEGWNCVEFPRNERGAPNSFVPSGWAKLLLQSLTGDRQVPKFLSFFRAGELFVKVIDR